MQTPTASRTRHRGGAAGRRGVQ